MLRRLIATAKETFPDAKIHMAPLQWNPTRITSKEAGALKDLNAEIEKLTGVQVLPELSVDQFRIEHKDPYGIHWTTECANSMLKNWTDALN